MKGAVDGGLNIPHNVKRFPGYDKDDKSFDAETLSKYIYGGHVAEYMEGLEEEDEEKYNKHFAKFVEEDVDADGMEDLLKEVHSKPKAWHQPKRSYAQRKDRVKQLVNHRNAME